MYCIEENCGGVKTLVNLANHHNSTSFFANIPDEARGHAVCRERTTREARKLIIV